MKIYFILEPIFLDLILNSPMDFLESCKTQIEVLLFFVFIFVQYNTI